METSDSVMCVGTGAITNYAKTGYITLYLFVKRVNRKLTGTDTITGKWGSIMESWAMGFMGQLKHKPLIPAPLITSGSVHLWGWLPGYFLEYHHDDVEYLLH